jgi:hypothetical protein
VRAWSRSAPPQPYRSGQRGWRKIRTRLTGEAVVGGVLGTVCGPQALVLGRFDGGGRLRVAGCTRPLSAAAAREVVRLLVPSIHGHPWPDTIPSSRFGQWPNKPVVSVRVAPTVVVELEVDTAYEQERSRVRQSRRASGGPGACALTHAQRDCGHCRCSGPNTGGSARSRW